MVQAMVIPQSDPEHKTVACFAEPTAFPSPHGQPTRAR